MSAAPEKDPRLACDMAALVEARRDGRVGDRESASLDRHLVGCVACRAFAADLDRLAQLSRGARRTALSPLDQRRERLRLLRGAAFAPSAAAAGARTRVQSVRLAAVAAVIVGGLAGGTALALRGLPSPTAGPQTVESSPSSATVFAAVGPTAPLAEALAPEVEAAPAPVLVASSPPHLASPRPKKAIAAPSARGAAAVPPVEGGASLADGVELIERGDYGAAVARLRAFRESHGEDPRAEDAAFLAVLALERAGRHAAAVAAAREYLTSYPTGYRRSEAQSIAAAP